MWNFSVVPNNENYVSNELLIKLHIQREHKITRRIWIRKANVYICKKKKRIFSKVDYVILMYEHPIALNVKSFPSSIKRIGVFHGSFLFFSLANRNNQVWEETKQEEEEETS